MKVILILVYTLMVMSGRSCLATAFLANKNFHEAKMRAEDQLPEWRDPDFAAKAEDESEKGRRSEPMLHVMRAINLHPVLSTAHELLASSKTEKRQKYRNLLSILLELDARDSQSQTPELQQTQDSQDYEEPSLDIRGKSHSMANEEAFPLALFLAFLQFWVFLSVAA
ncbi:uncharacterized protein LOC112560907 [Pomacea canaliculata]|uniref:uncharacterized protein LOC112560907 n=1 Tax=Pomacea canaliculata TaxID=400727 RepID=UPI000D72D524|nr:uncharacterized protein LOC112560907 [Pomacea canaliculata]